MDLLKIPFEHPFAIEWKMKKSDLESLKTSTKKYLTNQYIFSSKIAGVGYRFLIYPYGGRNDETLIYLDIEIGSVKEIQTKFKISIESANFEEIIDYVYNETAWKCIFCYKSDEFFDPSNNAFVNDEIVIKLNGSLKFDRPLVSKISYPIHLKWNFNAFDLEPLQTSINECVSTKIYSIPSNPDIKYYLQIYPNGSEDRNRGNVYVVLHMMFKNDKKIEAAISLKINSNVWSKNVFYRYQKSKGYGNTIFSTEDFFDLKNGYFINGEITIELEGHIFVEKKDLEFELHRNKIDAENLSLERNFTFVVDGKEINVHQDLLSNASTFKMFKSGLKETTEKETKNCTFVGSMIDFMFAIISLFLTGILEFMISNKNKDIFQYCPFNIVGFAIHLFHGIFQSFFAGMMKSGMKETNENRLEITDFPFKTVDSAIKLIYGISPNFTLEDMLPLLAFSDKYEIHLVKDLIEDYLIKELAPSNVCQLIHFSNLFNASKLYEKSAEFFRQCSKNSTFVNDLDLIDKEMFYKIFSPTFPPTFC